jgi:hypothetical protein
MNIKTERIVEDLVRTLSGWDCVDAVVLGESALEEMNDPYFFLTLDVYYHGTLPASEVRDEAFAGGAFETSRFKQKDRFLINDIPVRLEYKDKAAIDDTIARMEDLLGTFREIGTYMFYRIVSGKVLLKKTDWLEETHAKLRAIPESFWRSLSLMFLRRMEHALSDMGAAIIRDDPYFFVVSSGVFIRSLASCAFAANRRFEPSDRYVRNQITNLPRLPDHFRGHFESMLREDVNLGPERKRQIAEFLVKGFIGLIEP